MSNEEWIQIADKLQIKAIDNHKIAKQIYLNASRPAHISNQLLDDGKDGTF
jgi:type III secretory pathway component EscU